MGAKKKDNDKNSEAKKKRGLWRIVRWPPM